jgi:RNA polymerase sigma factor (sigma-70 family)
VTTEAFEDHRDHLRGVALRLLGSSGEADDAVQEAWLRLQRSDTTDVANLRGWLTTVVARICLDALRTRKARREEPIEREEVAEVAAPAPDPERALALADSVGMALLVVLDKLDPAERIAFVLHDVFAVSFDEIAAILGRSALASRQLASRARRRVRGGPPPASDLARQRPAVEAFLAALRAGDVDGLLAVLDPDVVVRVDGAAGGGESRELRGARTWAQGAVAYKGAMQHARIAIIDNSVGIVMMPHDKLLRALMFEVIDGKIIAAEIVAEQQRLDELEIRAIE